MRIVAFCLTIILSFSALDAAEDNDDYKSKRKAEYYWKLNLAKAYERGTILKKNEKKAFLYYLKAATNYNYSEPEALEYLEKKAKEGNPYAEWNYGNYYSDPEIRSYDLKKSFYWFSKAAEKNMLVPLANVAHRYIYGRGVKKDVKKGIELMSKSAELGTKSAQEYLAYLYAGYDDIMAPNYKEAFKWMEVLAKKGYLLAKYDMGVCYFYGRGVPEDKSKAVEIWKSILEEIVETENYFAENRVFPSLYECYINGWGVAKDEEKANELLLLMNRGPSTYRNWLKEVLEKHGTLIRFTFQKPLCLSY